MRSDTDYNEFNPSGVGLKNGHFIGLPFNRNNAAVHLLPVPWDLTTSYRPGTAGGPRNILKESVQLDLYDAFVPEGWKSGIYMLKENDNWLEINRENRVSVEQYIAFLEKGGLIDDHPEMKSVRDIINKICHDLHEEVYTTVLSIVNNGRIPGIIGGEHSVAWGALRALAEKYNDGFGIFQFDAHLDMRKCYEGLDYSHASIMYNALHLKQVEKLVQVGARDYCQEEKDKVREEADRISVFDDYSIRAWQYRGINFDNIAADIVDALPGEVYISFDIDGLDPSLCPGTGTPVPGGLSYNEALHIMREVVKSGRKIIGFDLSETAGSGSWDGNVGARIAYQLSILAIKSWNLA